MLACSTAAFGSKEYRCSHANCTHHKYIHQTCKSRFCSSCGLFFGIIVFFSIISLVVRQIFLGWAKQLDMDIGMFCALHTYGRKLNWNVHIHLSVTRGGLCKRTGLWKPIVFKAKTTEKCWRAAITQLLSSNYSELDLSGEGCPYIRNEQDWSRFLTSQYAVDGSYTLLKKRPM